MISAWPSAAAASPPAAAAAARPPGRQPSTAPPGVGANPQGKTLGRGDNPKENDWKHGEFGSRIVQNQRKFMEKQENYPGNWMKNMQIYANVS